MAQRAVDTVAVTWTAMLVLMGWKPPAEHDLCASDVHRLRLMDATITGAGTGDPAAFERAIREALDVRRAEEREMGA